MKFIKPIFEYFNKYTEIEFVCHNSDYSDNVYKTNLKAFYERLKEFSKNSNYKIVPYMQDFSEDNHDELSLAVIILDNGFKKDVLNLSKQFKISVDLYNTRDDKFVDNIIKKNYNNLI